MLGEYSRGKREHPDEVWNGEPKFASTDFRNRKMEKMEAQERRSASCIINELNQFCRQGPGQFDLNGYPSVKYCKLCEKHCICVLKKCNGPPPLRKSPVTHPARRIDSEFCIPRMGEGSS